MLSLIANCNRAAGTPAYSPADFDPTRPAPEPEYVPLTVLRSIFCEG